MTQTPQPKKDRSPLRLLSWGFFLAFATLLVFLVSRSLQPRMPGMPITGGSMNMQPTPGDAKPPQTPDPSGQTVPQMPGMK